MSDSDSGGTTVGVWIPEDSDVLDTFDARVVGDESRSARLVDSMRLAVTVEDALGTVGVDLDPREQRAVVRQALLDHFRDERE